MAVELDLMRASWAVFALAVASSVFAAGVVNPQNPKAEWQAWIDQESLWMKKDSDSPFAIQDIQAVPEEKVLYLESGSPKQKWLESSPARVELSVFWKGKGFVLKPADSKPVELELGKNWVQGSKTVSAGKPEAGKVRIYLYDSSRNSFGGLKYFPFDEKYRVKAKLVRKPEPRKMTLTAGRGRKVEAFEIGVIEFEAGSLGGLMKIVPISRKDLEAVTALAEQLGYPNRR